MERRAVHGSASARTANALQPAIGSVGGYTDAFVAKLSAGGSQVYSTYLGGGGCEDGYSVAADPAGNAYVTGETYSLNFPTANALPPANGGSYDALVTKLSANGSSLVYSTVCRHGRVRGRRLHRQNRTWGSEAVAEVQRNNRLLQDAPQLPVAAPTAPELRARSARSTNQR